MTAKTTKKAKEPVKSNPRGPKSKGLSLRRHAPVEFEFHLGALIRQTVKDQGLMQSNLAKALNITSVGMNNKLNAPAFGNVYDIVKASLFLNVDLFAKISQAFADKEMEVFVKSIQSTQNQANRKMDDYEILKKENALLQELVKLRTKSKK